MLNQNCLGRERDKVMEQGGMEGVDDGGEGIKNGTCTH